MNRRVGSMNLWLDRALMRYDMSHINIINASSFVRVDCMRHGLNLNLQGKKMLMQLVVERVVDGQVSSTSSIPVITRATASPFLA
jgi:predicted DNA-binding ribbon-helix-helix protein